MFSALFFAGLLLIALFGGKAFLIALANQPLIGPLATWSVEHVGQLEDGPVANLIYGAIALQLLLMALAPVFYGPALVRKVLGWFRALRVAARS